MKLLFYAGDEFLSDQRNGGQQVSLRNYNFLCKIFGTKNIYILIFGNHEFCNKNIEVKNFPKHKNKIEQYYNCIFMRNGYSRSVEKKVVNYIVELQPDIIFFDHTFTGGILCKLKKKMKKNLFIITYVHNVVKHYVWEKVIYENYLYFMPYLSYSWNEKILMKESDSVIVLNQRDAEEIKKIYKRKASYILPVTYQDRFDISCINSREKNIATILFVGSYFGPNIKGIRWFIKKVMPYIKDKIKLQIIGKNMERLRSEFQDPYIEVVGTVNEIEQYYYDADLVIIPIPYGSGMKTKTAEAMMYGKYIIATKEALEGYDVEDLQYVKECNTENEFIKEISYFLKIKNENGYYPEVRNRFLDRNEHEHAYKEFENFIKRELKGV